MSSSVTRSTGAGRRPGGPAGLTNHRILLSLDTAEYRALEDAAEEIGLRPQELARRLISRSLTPGVGSQSLDLELLAHRVSLLDDAVRRQADALQRLEERASHASESGAVGGERRPARQPRSFGDDPPRARLHEEIAAVLRETGRPLTSAEIAERIRKRGRFEPPRSKRPVDVLMVASRISHENYKHLFTREGGLVRLAGESDRRRSSGGRS